MALTPTDNGAISFQSERVSAAGSDRYNISQSFRYRGLPHVVIPPPYNLSRPRQSEAEALRNCSSGCNGGNLLDRAASYLHLAGCDLCPSHSESQSLTRAIGPPPNDCSVT